MQVSRVIGKAKEQFQWLIQRAMCQRKLEVLVLDVKKSFFEKADPGQWGDILWL
jgi:hypothetical protein